MAKKLILGLGLLVLMVLLTWSWNYYQANRDFTAWMSLAELGEWQKQFDTNPPGGHPNYWDKGHWIDAVEARWHKGIPQYRVRYSAVPDGFDGAWYWYINQEQSSFSGHVHELADEGFALMNSNSYLRPDDSRRYQGVWHKLFKKKPAASSPAARPAH